MGDRCTLSPLIYLFGAILSRLLALRVVVGGGGWVYAWYWGVGRVGCYCDPWCAYLNRFSPAPSFHCGRCTLIRCAGTQDPHMQWWVARTKVIAILLLTYPHVFD